MSGRPAPHRADQSRAEQDPPVGVSAAATVTTAATATPIHHAAIAASMPSQQTPCRLSAAPTILSVAARGGYRKFVI